MGRFWLKIGNFPLFLFFFDLLLGTVVSGCITGKEKCFSSAAYPPQTSLRQYFKGTQMCLQWEQLSHRAQMRVLLGHFESTHTIERGSDSWPLIVQGGYRRLFRHSIKHPDCLNQTGCGCRSAPLFSPKRGLRRKSAPKKESLIVIKLIQSQPPVYMERKSWHSRPVSTIPSHLLLLVIAMAIVQESSGLQFSLDLPPSERFCFYEVFQMQQKYTLVTTTPERNDHEVEVSHIFDKSWKSVFYKASSHGDPIIRVDKLAAQATTYSFCIKNNEPFAGKIKVTFTTGLDMMELTNLPDATDAQNMDRQLNWLEQQLNKMAEKADSIEILRRVNTQIHGMVGVKMAIFGIIGLAMIAIVNFFFYRIVRSELKKRKFI